MPFGPGGRRSRDSAGRRSFELSDDGQEYVSEHREALGSPWEDASEDVPSDVADLRTLVGQLAMATLQVAQSGDEEQIGEAKKVLAETRKSLYRLLADVE